MTALRKQEDQLIEVMTPLLSPLGYQVVHVEVRNQKQKLLRIYIDHDSDTQEKRIGIEDCVSATRALNEPLDQVPLLDQIFGGPYELEVSSPGLDRPLRTARDFNRFMRHRIKLHTLRPLTAEECQDQNWCELHPKQKNFLGIITGVTPSELELETAIMLQLDEEGGDPTSKRKRVKKKKSATTKTQAGSNGATVDHSQQVIRIPLQLITRANLVPDFSTLASKEGAET